MKILLADDMHAMRNIIRRYLQELGYTDILEASDGLPAQDLLTEHKFDLVISDWNMPEVTGLQLLKYLKTTELNQKTPFIMLTSEAEKSQVITAIKEGVNNYIIKPVTKEKLKAKIDETLERLK